MDTKKLKEIRRGLISDKIDLRDDLRCELLELIDNTIKLKAAKCRSCSRQFEVDQDVNVCPFCGGATWDPVDVVRHEPKTEAELNVVSRSIGKMVQAVLPDGVHMVLFLMNNKKPGWISYVATARRIDVVDVIEEMLPKLKGGAGGPAAQAVLFEVVRRLKQVTPGTERQAIVDVADLVEHYTTENGWTVSAIPDLVRSFDGSIATLRAIRHVLDTPGPLSDGLMKIEWDKVRGMVKKYFEKFSSKIDVEEPGNPIGDDMVRTDSLTGHKVKSKCDDCGGPIENEFLVWWGNAQVCRSCDVNRSTTPTKICKFDTDGDGDCPIHPNGCPKGGK